MCTKHTTLAQHSAPSTLLLLSTITISLSTQHKEHYKCRALSTQCHCKGAYCHLHRLAIHKFVLSKNWRVNVIEEFEEYVLQTYSSTTGSYCLSYLQYPQSAHHCVYSTLYSVHPQSTSTPGSMAGIIAAEGASPSKHTSEQPVFMHQVQCHGKICINKCFL